MSTRAIIKNGGTIPSLIDDFFRPWNNWYDNTGLMGNTLNMPAVNITEHKDEYAVSLAVPGMKKDDFSIDVEGDMLTVSCNREEKKEEKQAMYTRREYNYSSFSRSFTLPAEVQKDKIDARYDQGVLQLILPKKEGARKLPASKHIPVK